ncbi:MAG: hypothetical protein CTY25_12010 [Methylobacterium sp.]|nr:MAG: hypothetical protein CTY25_12010 [Methylobacterium sp.]
MRRIPVSFALVLFPTIAFAEAEKAVEAFIRNTVVPCYKLEGEGRCKLAETAARPTIHYAGDGAMKIALAFVPWQWDLTGNAMDQMLVVFDQRQNGDWKPTGRLDRTYGSNPRDLKFFRDGEKVRIEYVGTVVGRRDNRANPTGSQRFAVEVLPNGQMRATKPHGRSMSEAIRG